jgi:hypothetical protein
MVRLRSSLLLALIGATVVWTAGCSGGGGSHASTLPTQTQPLGAPTPSPYTGPQSTATKITAQLSI